MFEIKNQLQLFRLTLKQPFPIDYYLVVTFLEAFIWSEWGLIDPIEPECLRMISELLPIETDINKIEWIVIIKLWNIRQLTTDIIFLIMPLRAYPVLHRPLLLHFGVVLEPDSNAVDVTQCEIIQGKVNG